MAESHQYPLRIQQSKLDGWWFIFVDEVPELGVIGPNYQGSLDQLKVQAGKLFRARRNHYGRRNYWIRETGVTGIPLNAPANRANVRHKQTRQLSS
jgi:hypothetical protein